MWKKDTSTFLPDDYAPYMWITGTGLHLHRFLFYTIPEWFCSQTYGGNHKAAHVHSSTLQVINRIFGTVNIKEQAYNPVLYSSDMEEYFLVVEELTRQATEQSVVFVYLRRFGGRYRWLPFRFSKATYSCSVGSVKNSL